MDMAQELDAGDIIAQVTTPVSREETAQQLYDRLARMGGGLLVQAVAAIEGGTARRTPQDPAQVTFAPMLSRELSPMDWSHPAQPPARPGAGAPALARSFGRAAKWRQGKSLYNS